MQDDESHLRIPVSEFDFNMHLTNSSWGSNEVSTELKDVLRKYYKETDGKGNDVITSESLWGLLTYYTRDIRLGNLSEKTGELQACRHYLTLAGDLLYCGYIEPFMSALSRAVTLIETSQSKNGFLRQSMNTLTHKTINQDLNPPKKQFFGGTNSNNGGVN